MKLKPLADRVILKQFKAEEKTKSGLILAASAQEKPEMFEVVEVGPGGMVDGNEVKMTVAASVSSMVLTTESLVADLPEKAAPAAPAAPDMGGMY